MQELVKIIESDTTYNKSSTRYLSKTHPELWNSIVQQTSFLPDSAKPKQRVWHILNEVSKIPVCPESGLQCKWWENRYLTFATRSAKASYQNRAGVYQNQTEAAKQKRSQTTKDGITSGKIQYHNRKIDYVKGSITRKRTTLQQYGVENTSQLLDVRKKISDSLVANGHATPRHMRADRALYLEAVIRYTELSLKNNFDQINPTRENRSIVTLDHVYSVQQGFINNIPAYIIGHWTNLRMLPRSKNSAKGMRCDKTQDQLFEDFFKDKA